MRKLIFFLLCFLWCGSLFATQTKPYKYYVGPWVWDDGSAGGEECWKAPAGTVGLIDLRSISGMGKRGGVPDGYGFFAVDGTLSAP